MSEDARGTGVLYDEQGKPSLGRRCVLGYLLYVGVLIVADSTGIRGWETAPESWSMLTGVFWGLMAWVGVPRAAVSFRNGR